MNERWAVPVFATVAAIVLAAAVWRGSGEVLLGLGAGAILLAYAATVTLGARRSGVMAVLAGRAPDERWRLFDLRATAFAGVAVILAVLAAAVVEIAHGRSGSPYTQLAALAGLAYIAGVVVQSRRG